MLHVKLHDLLVYCREKAKLLQDFSDAVIATLCTKKDWKSDFSNYRGITLLSSGKVLANRMLNGLVPSIAEENLPDSQCGYTANRGTTYMVFLLRHIWEKCHEQNNGLFATFLDLTKKFLTQWAWQDYGSSWSDMAIDQFSTLDGPDAQEPVRPDQTQWWSVLAFSNRQQHEAWMFAVIDSH